MLDIRDMNQLEQHNRLLIKQVFETWEAVTNLETRNRYMLFDDAEKQQFYAYEQSGDSWLVRHLLKSLRSFIIRIIDNDKQVVSIIERPFRFYLHEIYVRASGRRFLGRVKRKFSLLHKHYVVFDSEGNAMAELKGPMWRPWTFNIVQNGKQYGTIRKRWNGLVGEVLTDTDTFGIEFPEGATEDERVLLLSAVFLIDFVHFEGR